MDRVDGETPQRGEGEKGGREGLDPRLGTVMARHGPVSWSMMVNFVLANRRWRKQLEAVTSTMTEFDQSIVRVRDERHAMPISVLLLKNL